MLLILLELLSAIPLTERSLELLRHSRNSKCCVKHFNLFRATIVLSSQSEVELLADLDFEKQRFDDLVVELEDSLLETVLDHKLLLQFFCVLGVLVVFC